MGDRATITILDEHGEKIALVYHHWRGRPEVLGKELSAWAETVEFNGVECLAASLVARLKKEPHNVYLYPPETTISGLETLYRVQLTYGVLLVNVECVYRDFKYNGPLVGLADFIEEQL